MKNFKERLIYSSLVVVILLAFLALDDSYENADLSAQVLDEAIAQAYDDKKLISRALIAQQAEADYFK